MMDLPSATIEDPRDHPAWEEFLMTEFPCHMPVMPIHEIRDLFIEWYERKAA